MVTEDDQASLLAGKPVRKVVDGARILLTPNGDCIRNLSADEEDRFLELQQLVAEATATPAAFVSSRHEAGGGFSLIKGRAVPNGPPSYFPPSPGAYPSDPVNKIQREEAIYYINQYVLPRLNLNARDMSLPKAMSTWTTDPRGTAAQAAANLNSVAPWLYGGISPSPHDLDAGAAPPELNYPGPVGAFADHHPHSLPHAPYLDMVPAPIHSHQADASDDGTVASGSKQQQPPAAAINFSSPGPFGSNVPLMSLEDAEQALSAARKETDKLEKSLNQLLRRNRRLLMAVPSIGGIGAGGGH
jgi:CCR4-NOT transcription complex subunit 4